MRRHGRRHDWCPVLLPLPEPYDFALSTERFRVFGVDRANLWFEGGLHRVIGGREVRIEAAPGGVEVEPWSGEIEAEVRTLLGAPFDLAGFAAFAAGDPVLAPPRARARRLPPAARAGPVRGARHLDHGPAGLAPVGVRDSQPPDRALRRAGRARDRLPHARAARRARQSPSSSRSASRDARPSTRSRSPAPSSTSTPSRRSRTTR